MAKSKRKKAAIGSLLDHDEYVAHESSLNTDIPKKIEDPISNSRASKKNDVASYSAPKSASSSKNSTAAVYVSSQPRSGGTESSAAVSILKSLDLNVAKASKLAATASCSPILGVKDSNFSATPPAKAATSTISSVLGSNLGPLRSGKVIATTISGSNGSQQLIPHSLKTAATGLSIVDEDSETEDLESSHTLDDEDTELGSGSSATDSSSSEDEDFPDPIELLPAAAKAFPAAASSTPPAAASTAPLKPAWRSLFAENRKSGNGMKLHKIEGLKGMKRIKMAKEDEKTPNNSWEHGLIGYIAGNRLGKGAIINYCNSWKIKYRLYFDSSGWMGLKFDSEEDSMRVLHMGPHIIFGRPFILKVMPRYFAFDIEELKHVPVWINLPKLPFVYWNDYAISRILSTIGTPIQTDIITQIGDGFSFALGLVEIDISGKLIEMIELELPDGKILAQRIEYEFVPGYCHSCNAIGHADIHCGRNKDNTLGAATYGAVGAAAKRAVGAAAKGALGAAANGANGAATVGAVGAGERPRKGAENPNVQQNEPTIICERCGLKGHMKETCRVNLNTCERCKLKGHGIETCRKILKAPKAAATPHGLEEARTNNAHDIEEEGEAVGDFIQKGPYLNDVGTSKKGGTTRDKSKDRGKRKDPKA